MILYPSEANRRPYDTAEYKRLTKKFCEICKNVDLHDYLAFTEFCLKTYHNSDSILDKKAIDSLKIQLLDNCLNYDEVTIFLNSVFLEVVTPFYYSKVKDLIKFLDEFPYKTCADCNI